MTGGILDLTGSALDAPPVICDGGRPLRPERWSPWRHGNWSYIVTAIGADGAPLEGATVDIGTADFTASSFEWHIPAGFRPLDPGGYVIGPRELSATFTFKVGPDSPLWHYAHAARLRGWSRCPVCHPRGNPRRLAVDGREYARRRKARKRRKRR